MVFPKEVSDDGKMSKLRRSNILEAASQNAEMASIQPGWHIALQHLPTGEGVET